MMLRQQGISYPAERGERKKAVALFRLGVITDFVGQHFRRGEKERLLREKTSCKWEFSNSRKDSVSRSSEMV
jgi:hypothetical protein